jgi:hypothetical protein
MLADARPWRSVVHLVVPHPAESAVLVEDLGHARRLPRAEAAERVWFPQLGRVSELAAERLGSVHTALRYLDFRTDEGSGTVEGLYEVEPADPAAGTEAPTGLRWCGAAELRTVDVAAGAHREALAAYLRERADGLVPAERAPWARPGWYTGAWAWVEAQLEAIGWGPIVRRTQLRVWGLSCVLRARTARGRVYFKASAGFPLAANEPALTAALAARFPARVPAPLAADPDRRWLLLADFGEPLGRDADAEALATAFGAFAEVQEALAGERDWLLTAGCADRPLTDLEARVAPLADDPYVAGALDGATLARLRALVPTLERRCRVLAAAGLPETLVHGDLGAHNVALLDGRPLFFDWAEGCVAHPFLDMVEAVEDPTAFAPARRRYLDAWAGRGSARALEAAWDLAAPLSALHVAVGSHAIQTSMEAPERAQLAWSLPRWLSLVVRTAEAPLR